MPDAGLDVVTMGGVPVTSVVSYPFGVLETNPHQSWERLLNTLVQPLGPGVVEHPGRATVTATDSHGERVLGGVHDRCARLRLSLHRLDQHMTEHVLAPPAGYGHLN